MESSNLKHLLDEIGNSVHSMNTIAIALSIMQNEDIVVPPELNISWKPKEVVQSKIRSRNYAEKLTYVYVAENLFEYLDQISQNPFWVYPKINFKGDSKKAQKVYDFLSQIPELEEELIILAELICHWRNRIVHSSTSKARLSSKKRDFLALKREEIYEKYHHFDVQLALENFENKKVTLKDVSTLTTIVIRCCRSVDMYFFTGIREANDFDTIKSGLTNNTDFIRIINQSPSPKRERQIGKWFRLKYPYIENDKISSIVKMF